MIVTAVTPPRALKRRQDLAYGPCSNSCLQSLDSSETTWSTLLGSISTTNHVFRLVWQWDSCASKHLFEKGIPRENYIHEIWPCLSSPLQPLQVREYLRAARLSRGTELDNLPPEHSLDSAIHSGNYIANFVQGHFGSELLQMLHMIDGEDVSTEVRYLIKCFGSDAEFVADVFQRRKHLWPDQSLEVLLECGRGVPFDTLLSHTSHGAHDHWVLHLLEQTGTIISEDLLLGVAENDAINLLKFERLLKLMSERFPITEAFAVRAARLGLAPSTVFDLDRLEIILSLGGKALPITGSLLERAAMS